MWNKALWLLPLVALMLSCQEETAVDSGETEPESVTETPSVQTPDPEPVKPLTDWPSTETVLVDGIPFFKIDWDLLATANFQEEYVEEEGAKFWIPTFSEELERMQGQNVVITGYLLPLEPEEDLYVLSANPNSSCFFCGAAGPETVMKIKAKKVTSEFYMDNRLTFAGQLKLNAKNLYEMNFVLDGALVIEE